MTPDNDNSILPLVWDGFKWVFGGLGVLAIGLVRSVRNRDLDRMKDVESRVSEVERIVITAPADYVSRDTFQRHERDTRDAIESLRKSLEEREKNILHSIEAQGDRIHSRIDELFIRNGGR